MYFLRTHVRPVFPLDFVEDINWEVWLDQVYAASVCCDKVTSVLAKPSSGGFLLESIQSNSFLDNH